MPLPTPLTQSSEQLKLLFLHWLFSRASRSLPRRRHQFPDARLPGARGGGTGSFFLLLVALLPALGGSPRQAAVCSRSSSSVLWARPYQGGPESILFLSLSGERLRLSPHPSPNRRHLKVPPPLVVLAGLTFLLLRRAAVPGCSPLPGAREEAAPGALLFLSRRLLPALVGRQQAAYSRSSSSVPGPRPKGRALELPLPLSHWEGPCPSQTLPQSSGAASCSFLHWM